MIATNIRNNRAVHLVAADADRTCINDTAQRQNRNFGRTAANINDHASGRLRYRQIGTDCRGHRLFNQPHLTRARRFGRFLNGPPLDRGRTRRDADDNHRRRERATVVNFADKIFNHLFGDFKIGNHAVAQRTNGMNVARRAAQHLFGFVAHRQNLFFAAIFFNRNHGRLVQHDTLSLNVDQRICGTQIHRHIG